MGEQDLPGRPPSLAGPGWPPAGAAAPGPPRPPAFQRPGFHGRGGTLFGIHVVNVLLTIVTLGVYYFWAKTRTRKYLVAQTEFLGDRFAYHGTPKELLLGMLKALLVFGLPLFALSLVEDVLDVPRAVKVAASLASACRLLLEDADLVAALGREARARYEEELAPQLSTARLLALYAEVMALPRGSAAS